MLLGETNVQRLDVRLQLFHLPSTNDREDVGRLVHHIRDGHCESSMRRYATALRWKRRTGLDALRADLLRDVLEGLADLAFLLVALPVIAHDGAAYIARQDP